jgi:hypothetical protein
MRCCPGPDAPRKDGELDRAIQFLQEHYLLPAPAAMQIATYLGEAKRSLGLVPTIDNIALERFFDESGGMQLVLHAPFGSRINKAWGLALRKKFCQGFNFELQAAATEEGLILSLSGAHSFPLEEVFRYLHPKTVEETLTQAIIQSPIFETRWRWASTLSLAVPRNRGGARVPNQLQRMYGEDLLSAVFPDAVACQDNIQGAREIPDHPLVSQALRDSLGGSGRSPRPRAPAHAPVRRGDPLHRPRHARTLRVEPRAAEFRRVHLPRRCAARGAPHPRRAHAPRDRGPHRRRSGRPGRRRHRTRPCRSVAHREHARRDV